MKLLLCAFITLVSLSVFAQPKAAADTIDVSTIIDRSEKAYHNLKIYLDSGKVIQAMEVLGRPTKTAKYFKTAYSADGGFNFEYYELGKSNSLYTINRTQGVVRTWWGTTGKLVDPEKSLQRALSGAAGGSSSLSTLIPGILLQHEFPTWYIFYHTLGFTELIGSEIINNIDCYKLSSSKGNTEYLIWISKKDYLIRKVETQITITAAQTIANQRLLDSLLKKQALRDTAFRRADSTRRAVMAKYSSNTTPNDINVKSTYFYYPYTLKTPNPELFKFRPNREIEL